MTTGARDQFIEAAFWHGSRERADAILLAHPELGDGDIHVAAMLGDAETVQRLVDADPGSALARGGPRHLEPLVHLCFSVYLREKARSDAFVRAATTLLDAGADPNGGFLDETHTPHPTKESLVYGTAGVHFHAPLTRLLLERGADPNDDEVPYHSVEGPDNDAFRVLVESGKMTPDSLATMLLRKADWHDHEGLELLLRHGVDPNHRGRWDFTTLSHAIRRDNSIVNIDLLLEHGASVDSHTAPIAASRGRRDVLESLSRRGVRFPREGVDALIIACALDDSESVERLRADGAAVEALRSRGSTLLAEFAGNDNRAGLGWLLDLGVPIDARYSGDGYFGIPSDSTALHVAAWRASPGAVDLLVARGADVNARDGNGRPPAALFERAATESYWTERARSTNIGARLNHTGGAPPRP